MEHNRVAAETPALLQVTADPAFEAAFTRELPKQLPYEVISAASVEEALRTLRERNDVVCIVSDHDLSDIDGIAFLETVRAQRPDQPFILVTSEGNERVASRAIHAHVTDYLIKERIEGRWARLASLITRAIDFHRTRAPLNDPETRTTVILEAIPDAMAVLQGDSIVYANGPALDLLGADDCDALEGVSPATLISPETHEITAETLAAIRAGERQIDRLEQPIVGLDGLVTPVELTAAAIDWRGEPSVLLICRDVSERRARARELERRNARLNEIRRVTSHQLRSPLAAAQGRLELVREECESDHLEALEETIDRIVSIIEDTETLTNLDETVTEADAEPIRVTDFATSCWRMVEAADATLAVVDEMRIRGDPDRLSHLFENLFRNAIEYGGEDVTVRVGRFGEDGLYVEDDGPGIPVDRRERLVDPKRTSGPGRGGTGTGSGGLGLLIVGWIAEAHVWQFTITEGDDGGARIEFTGVEFLP
ncbi:hypothetical protein BRC93_07675 [Halobacteriales archaeon QS_5_70_15]|nr:MAG: hypothetical protein BRC93_07675 [Halobacteriales archaeon QS_5_70_15]